MAHKEPTMSNRADYDPPEGARALKTWSYLSDQKRRPSEYDIVSTRLFYHRDDPKRPWTIGLEQPLNLWYRTYASGSPLTDGDWEAFRDPDRITYRAFNILQDEQEAYVDGLLEHYSGVRADAALDAGWLACLARLYTPSRYALHTVQMASSYLFHMAPSSTIGICAAFQAADQLRWLQRTAYRTVELANTRPGFGFNQAERERWERDPAWQGFRELMEKALVAYDWGECFASVCLVAKPALDECLFRQLGRAGHGHGDALLDLLAEAALRDSARARRWAQALARFIDRTPANRAPLKAWIEKWTPLADAAIAAYCAAIPGADAGAAKRNARAVWAELGFEA